MTAIRKPKRQVKMKTLADKLWAIARQIVFIRHGIDCYTCPQKRLEGRNLQCGHGFPKGALSVQMAYDLRILRPQCYSCNLNHGGMGAVFWKNLERDLGIEVANVLLIECQGSKGNTTNARAFYAEMTPLYQIQLDALRDSQLY